MSANTPEDEGYGTARRISARWKVMLALGSVLILLGLCIDWPPSQESHVPDTSLFLIILGGLLSATGLLAMLRHE